MTHKKALLNIIETTKNELEKYVAKDILESSGIEGYLKDIFQGGCASGIVSSLIYFQDTRALFIKYMDEIDELRQEVEESIGGPLEIKFPLYNHLAWFGYEQTARLIAEKLEISI
jgi:hypothetical protein